MLSVGATRPARRDRVGTEGKGLLKVQAQPEADEVDRVVRRDVLHDVAANQ